MARPFITSIPFRVLLAATSTCLLGGGLVTALGLSPTLGVPAVFAVAAIAAIAAFYFAVHDYPKEAFFCVATMPPAFIFALYVALVAVKLPTVGWLLVAASGVPLIVGVITTRTVAAREHRLARAQAHT